MCVSGLKIGLEPVLPYLDPLLDGNALLRGANFASAGIGILNDPGLHLYVDIRHDYCCRLSWNYL